MLSVAEGDVGDVEGLRDGLLVLVPGMVSFSSRLDLLRDWASDILEKSKLRFSAAALKYLRRL